MLVGSSNLKQIPLGEAVVSCCVHRPLFNDLRSGKPSFTVHMSASAGNAQPSFRGICPIRKEERKGERRNMERHGETEWGGERDPLWTSL